MKYRPIILILLAASQSLYGFGMFSPVSGVDGQPGHRDGSGGTALFSDPMGMARDAQGNLYVCDARNHVIRKISTAGVVSTLAGMPGVSGIVNGKGSAARFNFPADIAISPAGTLYVADSGNHCIRAISTDGTVGTLAGDPANSNDIEQDYGTSYPVVATQLDGKGPAATFNTPSGIAYAPAGFLYVSDTGNHIIRQVNLDGTVISLAGMPGVWGGNDGTGTAARFNSPMGLCVAADGNLYIADSLNHVIRRMTPAKAVTRFSGKTGEFGFRTGTGIVARFSEPTDIAPHPKGGFIVCESFGNSLFRLSAQGDVTLFAGNTGGQTQMTPTPLFRPSSAVCDNLGNVYVADTFNQQVSLIIEKFDMTVARANGTSQLTIAWDSLPGRNYQLQVLGAQGWVNSAIAPVRATTAKTTVSFPMPQDKVGIYRILLLGF